MINNSKPSCSDEWNAIIEYVDREIKVTETVLLHKKASDDNMSSNHAASSHNAGEGSMTAEGKNALFVTKLIMYLLLQAGEN